MNYRLCNDAGLEYLSLPNEIGQMQRKLSDVNSYDAHDMDNTDSIRAGSLKSLNDIWFAIHTSTPTQTKKNILI